MTPPLVLHDFFTFPGGGERVATTLALELGAQLWAGDLAKESFPEGYFDEICPRSLQARQNSPVWLRYSKICRLWWSFAHFPRCSPPWTIFSGSLAPLAHSNISGRKILYCHTPPRLLYDQHDFYLADTALAARIPLFFLSKTYQKAYERSIRAMDVIIANSRNVQSRIEHYLGSDSFVVYPPVMTEYFKWLGNGDYYLSTARVDSLKRVALIVEAFGRMPDKKLVVVSGGGELNNLKRFVQDAKNIHFTGWVSDIDLRNLIGNAIATIYIPRDEDFGMSPVESMAAGKPVIGVAEGGLLETVVDGETGVLLPAPPTVEAISEAVLEMTPAKARQMRQACESRARKFDKQIFVEKMKRIISGYNDRSDQPPATGAP